MAAVRNRQDVLNLINRSKALEGSCNMLSRYEMASELVEAGQVDEAVQHYVWCLENMPSSCEWRGPLLAYVIPEMGRLAHQSQALKQVLEVACSRAAGSLGLVVSKERWQEWHALCLSLGHVASLLSWYDERLGEHGQLACVFEDEDAEMVVCWDLFEVLVLERQLPDAANVAVGRAVRMFEYLLRRRLSALSRIEREMSASNGTSSLPALQKARDSMDARCVDDTLQLMRAMLTSESMDSDVVAIALELFAVLKDPAVKCKVVGAIMQSSGDRAKRFDSLLANR